MPINEPDLYPEQLEAFQNTAQVGREMKRRIRIQKGRDPDKEPTHHGHH